MTIAVRSLYLVYKIRFTESKRKVMGLPGEIDLDRETGTGIGGGEKDRGLEIVNIGTDHGIGIGKGMTFTIDLNGGPIYIS